MAYSAELLRKFQQFRDVQLFCDCLLRVKTTTVPNDQCVESDLYTHKLILAAASPLFKEIFRSGRNDQKEPVFVVNLKLHSPNSLNCLKVALHFVYSGELQLHDCQPEHVLQVANVCRLSSLEELLHPFKVTTMSCCPCFTSTSPTTISSVYGPTDTDINDPEAVQSIVADCHWSTSDHDPHVIGQSRRRTDKREKKQKEKQWSPLQQGLFDNLGHDIVPSTDNEGWCRNKKYIERIANGFMCTVCRKVYGRYNSVSYHVTIYHRNPPIKCTEKDCQFTTREARYIHFHKYYRHRIALPESIDLGSRKCPFCRHVSKSPAMLEKHINRHLPEEKHDCQRCYKQSILNRNVNDHLPIHTDQSAHRCDQCRYKCRTSGSLDQHKLFKHSREMFLRKLRCSVCPFVCSTTFVMDVHNRQTHQTLPLKCTTPTTTTNNNNNNDSSLSHETLAPPPPNTPSTAGQLSENHDSSFDDSHNDWDSIMVDESTVTLDYGII